MATLADDVRPVWVCALNFFVLCFFSFYRPLLIIFLGTQAFCNINTGVANEYIVSRCVQQFDEAVPENS